MNNSSLEYEEDEVFGDTPIGDEFKIYAWPLLLVVGTLGNTMSLIVLRKLSRDVMSTCLYLAIECAADLIVLFTRCGNAWVLIMTDYEYDVTQNLMACSEMICKSLPFVCGSIYHLSRWLVTAATMEGFIAAVYPHSVPTRCTLTHAQTIVMLMTSLVICINIHYFWSFELVHENGHPMLACTFAKDDHRQSVFFQTIIWPALNNAVTDFIPSLLIIICTASMAVSVAVGRHRGSVVYRHWRQRYIIEPDGVEQLVWLYLAVGVMFICLLLPKLVFELSQYFIDQALEQSVVMMWMNEVSMTFEYGWLSLKAIVYVISSGRFRREVANSFRLW